MNASVTATPRNPTLWLKHGTGTGVITEIMTVAKMDPALNVLCVSCVFLGFCGLHIFVYRFFGGRGV